MQMVELLYAERPSCDCKEVAKRVNQIAETGTVCAGLGENGEQMHFSHKSFTWDYKEDVIPAQTAFMPTDHAPSVEEYRDLIEQSWACPNAEALVSQGKHVRLLTEFMAQGLDSRSRLTLFHATLQAMIELTQPVALAFKHSAQIVAADEYMANVSRPFWTRLGVVNVRFYGIAESEKGDMIMDTRGLDELGIPDFQCHFRGLDPNGIALNLSSLGMYVAEKGAVIESGHTVPGLNEDSKWLCQLEDSLLEPTRSVLDINPGPPYAAGNRDEIPR